MKNKFMRLAAVMLMLCLVTCCAIGGTFAKYTTDVSGNDTARVARWGFNDTNTSVSIDNLFLDGTYDSETGILTGGDDLIAPGSKNDVDVLVEYDGSVTPEVAYTITVAFDETNSAIAPAIKNNTNIKWYYNGAVAGTNGTWDELIDAVNGTAALSFDADTVPEASTDPDDPAAGTNYLCNIGWEWVFETDAAQDTTDTNMGNSADDLEVTIVLTVTITQKN
ncbi:MAG: hypothetical protein IJY24_07400 [Clostridia bacterium]|nr:hypothetical protein [Clostridia bacterium]